MENKELLEAIRQIVKEENQEIKKDVQEIKDRTQRIEDRTLKIEVTIENETNRNIMLMMEAQSLNAEKLSNIENTLDDFDSSIVAMEAMTVKNIKDIRILKKKAQ